MIGGLTTAVVGLLDRAGRILLVNSFLGNQHDQFCTIYKGKWQIHYTIFALCFSLFDTIFDNVKICISM